MARPSRARPPWYLINPRTNQALLYWDALSAVLLCYTAVITPLEVAFIAPMEITPTSVLFIVNRVVDVVFTVDMVLQFFIMLPIERKVEVGSDRIRKESAEVGVRMQTSMCMIAKHYLAGWFLIDLISVLTGVFDIMLALRVEADRQSATEEGVEWSDAALQSQRLASLRLLRVLRVLRLIKLVRLAKTSRLALRWQAQVSLDYGTQVVVGCLLAYLLAGHWFACVLVITTTFADSRLFSWLGAKGYCIRAVDPTNPEDPSFHYGPTWVQEPRSLDPNLAYLDDVWCVSAWDLWSRTYYWMMMFISGAAGGDTDLHKIQSYEAMVFTVLTVLSCLLMSQIIALFCSVLTNMSPEKAHFHHHMDRLNQYCRANQLATATRVHLREYLFRAEHVQIELGERELMGLLSPKLQGDLLLQHVKCSWLMTVSFLRTSEAHCVVRVALALEPTVFTATEVLPSDCMYHLSRGIVVVRGEVVLGGATWGIDCILSRTDLRSRPARALSYADVTFIHRDQLLAIIYEQIEGVDRHGEAIQTPRYPIAFKSLRFAAVRLGIVREMLLRGAGRFRLASKDVLRRASTWSSMLKGMDAEDSLQLEPKDATKQRSGHFALAENSLTAAAASTAAGLGAARRASQAGISRLNWRSECDLLGVTVDGNGGGSPPEHPPSRVAAIRVSATKIVSSTADDGGISGANGVSDGSAGMSDGAPAVRDVKPVSVRPGLRPPQPHVHAQHVVDPKPRASE